MRDTTETKFNRALILIEGGARVQDACRAVGIGRSTLYEVTGADPGKADALKKALTRRNDELEEEALASVRGAFAIDWRSAGWFLERTKPEKYALRHQFRDREKEADPAAATEAHARLLATPDARQRYIEHLRKRIEEIENMPEEAAAAEG